MPGFLPQIRALRTWLPIARPPSPGWSHLENLCPLTGHACCPLHQPAFLLLPAPTLLTHGWFQVRALGGGPSSWASLVTQPIKNPPAMQETQVWFLSQADPLEKG